jgi:membrane-associated phospholipid phosphatase
MTIADDVEASEPAGASSRFEWRQVAAIMTRPQPVTLPMVVLFALVPFYIFIGNSMAGRIVHVPEIALDRAIPLAPGWSVVYLSLFLAALMPVLVVHRQEHVRRTINAFLFVWIVGYVFFLAFPTVSSRPARLAGDGFVEWLLRTIYASDVRYNCFPSLHVAQCFLAALTCGLVNRRVGIAAGIWASLVALSTLFTKQHYVLDVLAGIVLAVVAYGIFLRGYPRCAIPELERRYAPVMAIGAASVYGIIVAILWMAYTLGIKP